MTLDPSCLRPATRLVQGGVAANPSWRNRRGAVSDVRLRLRQRGTGRGDLRRQRRALSVFPLRQPHADHAGRAAVPDRGSRGLPHHRNRHGGGQCGAAVASEGRRPGGGLARTVRVVPLDRLHPAAEVRHRRRNSSTAPTWTSGAPRWRVRRNSCCWKRRPTRCWSWSICRRWRSWRTPPARSSSSTTSSPRPCCSSP